jgi:hypothetical protein
MYRCWKRTLRPTTPMIVLFFPWFSIHPWNFAAADSHSSKLPGMRAGHQVSHPLPARPESHDAMPLTEALAQIESTLAAPKTKTRKTGSHKKRGQVTFSSREAGGQGSSVLGKIPCHASQRRGIGEHLLTLHLQAAGQGVHRAWLIIGPAHHPGVCVQIDATGA